MKPRHVQDYAQNHTRSTLRVVVPCEPPVTFTLGPLGSGEDRIELDREVAAVLQNALHAREIPGVAPGDVSVRVRPLAAAAPTPPGPGGSGDDGDDGGGDKTMKDDDDPAPGGSGDDGEE